jgi:hypothetical protein
MLAAKRQLELVPADAITELAQVSPPLLATAAMRLQSRLGLSEHLSLPVNVVISNVPGPRAAMYFSGARMTNYIPVSMVTDAMGLNITVHSYLDRLDFGLIACRELVPDLWDLADLHIAELERLFAVTGAEWAEPQEPPTARRGRSIPPPPSTTADPPPTGRSTRARSTRARPVPVA